LAVAGNETMLAFTNFLCHKMSIRQFYFQTFAPQRHEQGNIPGLRYGI